jgi:hypothetical protein
MTTRDMSISLAIPVTFDVAGSTGDYDVTGYTKVQYQAWPALSTYTGGYDLVQCRLKGPPEQIAPVSQASKVLEIFTEKFKAGGFNPLELSIYADWRPTFWTNYIVIFKVYKPTATTSLAQAEMHQVQAVAAVIAVIAIALAVIAFSIAAWKVASVVGGAVAKTGSAGIWALIIIGGIVAYGWMEGKKPKKQREGTT